MQDGFLHDGLQHREPTCPGITGQYFYLYNHQRGPWSVFADHRQRRRTQNLIRMAGTADDFGIVEPQRHLDQQHDLQAAQWRP